MKQFKIGENDANQRLDKFLKKLFPRATRSLIYKINRKNKVKVKTSPLTPLLRSNFENSHTSTPVSVILQGEGEQNSKFKKRDNEYKLQVGDEVKIFLSDKDFEELTKKSPLSQPFPQGEKGAFNKKDIVYEDKNLLVINKNSGINVHPGDHKTKETNVISQVQDYLGEKLNSLTFKPSLIHRIDRDTSGILMIGKTKDILVKLVNDFKNHKKVKKTYYALVLGKLNKNKDTINKKLLRIENAKNQNKVQVSDLGQTAITHYKVLNEYKIINNQNQEIYISELEIQIETGRMHQIRVHLASIGHPIIGDKNYGDKKLNSFFARNFGLTRQALHAWKIDFFHYTRQKNMKLEARIKPDLKNFLEKIKKT